jgi:molybdate transport system substrate-binding protein
MNAGASGTRLLAFSQNRYSRAGKLWFAVEWIGLMKHLKTLLAAVCLAVVAGQTLAADKITVFAAASLNDVLAAAANDFKTETGTEVIVSLAASSALAKQLEEGAPAQVFISADEKWMDYVQDKGLIDPVSRVIVARNELVIAVAAASKLEGDAAAILGTEKFAMGDPENVPAGKYGKASLEKLGLWEFLKGNAVYAENVRAALAFVDKGELNAAIVYASDAFVDKSVKAALVFDPATHPAIVYPAAVMKDGGAQAMSFIDFLSGEKGQKLFVDKGFKPASP